MLKRKLLIKGQIKHVLFTGLIVKKKERGQFGNDLFLIVIPNNISGFIELCFDSVLLFIVRLLLLIDYNLKVLYINLASITNNRI